MTDRPSEESTRASDARARRDRRFGLVLVLGILSVPVLVHGVAITYMANADTELVRTDYYEAGLRHEDELAALRRGAQLGVTVALRQAADGARLRVDVAAPGEALDARATVRAQLYRPDDASADHALELRATATERGLAFASRPAPLRTGRWRARVEVRAFETGELYLVTADLKAD